MVKAMAKVPQKGLWLFLVGLFGDWHSSEHRDLDAQVDGKSENEERGGAERLALWRLLRITSIPDSGGGTLCLHSRLCYLLCSENTARYWRDTKKSTGVGETSLP